MKKVYFISGLGADKRSFSFLDLSFCEPHFIEWVKPATGETLASYAEKLFTSIDGEQATIVGLSFGGMLATEIAKNHPRTKVIIISSAKTFGEIPRYLRVWQHLPVYKLHSGRFRDFAGPFVLSLLGSKGREQQKVQREILKDSDPVFLRWAMDVIVKWKNAIVPPNVTHIHGSADKLLPWRYVRDHYTIPGGEHVMIMDMHGEVSALLKQLIAT